MKLELEITQKDKRLLIILLSVLAAVIFYRFGYLVIMGKINDLRAEQEVLMSQKEDIDTYTMMLGSLVATKENMDAYFEESVADYYDPMSNEEMDRILTGAALKRGLKVTSFSISATAEDADMTTYLNTAPAAEVETEETEGYITSVINGLKNQLGDSELPEESDVSVEKSVFQQTEVSMTVSGSQSQLEGLIDDFMHNYPSIRVTGFRYGNSVTDEGRELSVDICVYTCDKPEE